MKIRRKTSRVLCKKAALSAMLVSSASVLPLHAASAQVNDEAGEQERALAVVTVTGTRGALRDAVNLKRNADSFQDVIRAEDIGELPDANLAESLQRISGVQIIRDNAASREEVSGQTVNIRGLPALATVDGRTLLPGAITRDFDFRTLASEPFGALVISKTPTADLIEGGLGGTIELITRSPLEYDDRVFSVTGSLGYLEYADSVNPDLSAFYADNYLGGKLGVVVSLAYEDLDTRTDSFTARNGWTVEDGFTASATDLDGDGNLGDVYFPGDLRFWYQNDRRERLGLTGTVAFEATEELTLTASGNYSQFTREFENGVLRFDPRASNVVSGTEVVDATSTVVAGEFSGALTQSDGRLEIDEIETYIYGLNADWKREALSLNADIALAGGKGDGNQLINRYRLLESPTVGFDFRGGDVPSVSVTDAAGGAVDLTDRSLYRTDLLFNNPNETDNSEFSAKFDAAYDLTMGGLTRIQAGLRFTDADFEFNNFRQSGFNTAGNPVVRDANGDFIPADQSVLDPLLGAGFPVSDFLGGVSGDFPTQFLYTTYPGADVASAGLYADIYQLSAEKDLQRGSATDLNEKTNAIYIRGDFEAQLGSVPVSGNVGLRFVETELSSFVFLEGDGDPRLVEQSNEYSNTLPSLNVVADLSETLLLRVAAGRVMRRPNISELRGSTAVSLSDGSANSGNIALDPFLADQFDIGLEWYFSEGDVLSGSVFFKDVENFTDVVTETGVDLGLTGLDGNPILFSVDRPVNAGTAEIQGFELNFQKGFTELPGLAQYLGVFANYTYTDIETSSGQLFPELSEQVYNIVAYYDDGRFDARLAYNWRSEYASAADGANPLFNPPNLNIRELVGDSGQLDFAANYRINDNFDLLFEVLNVTDEDFNRFTGDEVRIREFRTGERRFNLGVRATF